MSTKKPTKVDPTKRKTVPFESLTNVSLVRVNEGFEAVMYDDGAYNRTTGFVEDKLVNVSEAHVMGADDDQKISKAQFAWVRMNNDFMISPKPNVEELLPGLYDVNCSETRGIYLSKKSVILDELFLTPDETINKIITDLEKFWSVRQKYEDYGLTYKRGILMYGPPGTGKTSTINLLIEKVVANYKGIAMNMDNLSTFIPMVQNIRALEPSKPILAIIEDLDDFLYNNSVKNFLNLLDGNLQVDNIVYLASTNYMERIEDRIKNRPSRFDRRYEIGYPSADDRKFYFEKKLKDVDLANIDLNKWVNDSQDFTFSHMKEMIASIIVMGSDYDEVMAQLKEMKADSYVGMGEALGGGSKIASSGRY